MQFYLINIFFCVFYSKNAVDNKAVKGPKINLSNRKKNIAPIVVAITGYKTECVKAKVIFGFRKFAILYR